MVKAHTLGSDGLCLNLGFSVSLLCDFEQVNISVTLFSHHKMDIITLTHTVAQQIK